MEIMRRPLIVFCDDSHRRARTCPSPSTCCNCRHGEAGSRSWSLRPRRVAALKPIPEKPTTNAPPRGRGARSTTVTLQPARARLTDEANPAIPAPTTMALRGVRGDIYRRPTAVVTTERETMLESARQPPAPADPGFRRGTEVNVD